MDPSLSPKRIDPFLRIFHWSLVAIVVSNRFLNEGGGNGWHAWLGYAACALVGFRLVWGFVGPESARFKNHRHSVPAVVVMSAMLFCILLLGQTGWMMSWDRFFGEEWLEDLHDIISNVLLALVFVHVAGVIRECFRKRENLVAAMIHGRRKR